MYREYPLTPDECFMPSEVDNVVEFMKGRFAGPEEYRSWCHTKDRKFLESHLKSLVGSEIYDAAAVARDVIMAKKKSEKFLLNEKTIYPGGAGQDSYK